MAKWPARPGTTSTFGWAWELPSDFANLTNDANGVRRTTSSVTSTSIPRDMTDSTPKSGRSWVSCRAL